MKFKMFLASVIPLPVWPITAVAVSTNTSFSLYSMPEEGFIGKTSIGTEVEVRKLEEDKAFFKISGLTLDESPSQIFQALDLRIKKDNFDEEASKINLVLKEKILGGAWIKASAKGWIETEELTLDTNKLWTKAKTSAQDVGFGCNALAEPVQFSANQLPSRAEKALALKLEGTIRFALTMSIFIAL